MLMDIEANPVAGPVDEELPVPAIGDDASRYRIDGLCGHTGPHRVDCCSLCPTQHCERLGEPFRHLAHNEHPGGVGEVAAERTAEVAHNGVAASHHPIRSLMMWRCLSLIH